MRISSAVLYPLFVSEIQSEFLGEEWDTLCARVCLARPASGGARSWWIAKSPTTLRSSAAVMRLAIPSLRPVENALDSVPSAHPILPSPLATL